MALDIRSKSGLTFHIGYGQFTFMRHDVLARKKYYKPFKSFKFNRARRQRP